MKRKNKIQITIILFIIFISMFLLNMFTPLIMDDYNYTYGLDGRIKNIKDILEYQYWFYFNWGGRNVAHILAQLFLMNNKLIFNVFNAAVYTLMIYLIYSIIKDKKEGYPIYLILIHFALWFLTPSFGQSFIWLTGSCNYLWTTTIILLFLNSFIHLSNDKKQYNIVQIILFGLFGIIAGWTNENSGASLIFILLMYISIKKIIEKKMVNKIQLIGLIGTILGFITMIIAPGNYVRSSGLEENTFFIIKWVKRAIAITQTSETFLLIPIIILVILITIYFYKKQKIDNKIYLFITGMLIAAYSMVLSPAFPERSWTIMIIYIIITCGILLYNLKLNNNLKKIIIIDCVIVLSFLFVNSYIYAFKESYKFYNTWQERADIINKGKKKGIKDYEFEPIYTSRKQTASYGLGDLYENINDSNNKTYARYFKVNSIKAKQRNES